MRIPRNSADAAILSAILLPYAAVASGTYDCGKIVVNSHPWDLHELGGPKSVLQSQELGMGFKNTTYTLDICKPLKKKNSKILCPNYSRVCAVERDGNKENGSDELMDSWALAGDLRDYGGKDLNAKWESLSDSDSHADSEKEGLRLTMNGGSHKIDGSNRPQKVIVEFICEKSLFGDENLYVPEDGFETGSVKRAEGNETDTPQDGEAKTPSLQFLKYDTAGEDTDVLRLEWKTKFACLDAKDDKDEKDGKDDPKDPNTSWGFFTWFIIIAFLSTATYLIFGSWLNYNRYGARGWDLLPHGDAIRDVPYLMKDWMRRVMVTVQGGGSRGGYAAV